MTRREKNNSKRDAKRLARASAGPKSGRVNPLCAVADEDHVSNWPDDFSDLARRIEQSPSLGAVTNYERDLLANGAPRGTFTRRDGTSIRPQYRDLANV